MNFRNKGNTYEEKLVVLDFLSKPQGNQVQLIYVIVHPFLGASFAPDNNK